MADEVEKTEAPSRGGVQGSWLTPSYAQSVAVGYIGTSGGIVRGTGADWFGPLNPINPSAPAEVAGRQWDFPPGYNLGITPRQYEQVGFPMLRALADSYDFLRLVIETRKDQIARMEWAIKARDSKKQDASKAKIKAATDFLARPDGNEDWPDWLRRILEDLFVVDAPTIFLQRTRGGQLYAMHPLDGATIVPKIDAWGRTPRPFVGIDGKQVVPVAYQQILKGIPAVDYSVNDLIYRPRNRRNNRAYGFGPVEQIVTTVNIGLRRMLFLLDYYTDGNIPDSLIGTPETWTPEQIKTFQGYWDTFFEGDERLAKRRRAKFVPGGMAKTFVQTKEPELKNDFDEWLVRVVCYAFSVSPQAFTRMMNRATAATARETAEEEGLAPVLAWIKTLMDGLLRVEFNSPELEFAWQQDKDVNELEQMQILTGYLKSGVKTVNQVRKAIGDDPDPNPAADKLMVETATGFVLLEANTIEGKKEMQAAFPEPEPQPNAQPEGGEQTAKPQQAAPPRRQGAQKMEIVE